MPRSLPAWQAFASPVYCESQLKKELLDNPLKDNIAGNIESLKTFMAEIQKGGVQIGIASIESHARMEEPFNACVQILKHAMLTLTMTAACNVLCNFNQHLRVGSMVTEIISQAGSCKVTIPPSVRARPKSHRTQESKQENSKKQEATKAVSKQSRHITRRASKRLTKQVSKKAESSQASKQPGSKQTRMQFKRC
jgi:hypothetical protein